MADQRNNCTGFKFEEKECQLYNLPDDFNLTHASSAGADGVFVFREKSPRIEYVDCQAAFEDGEMDSGVYRLNPIGSGSFDAWCDFDGSHGWTVIQRRMDGSVDFERDWDDFKIGFGNLDGELWLGNDKIHALTLKNRRLSIFLDKNGEELTANYSTFYVSDEEDNYRLTIYGFSGNTHNAMTVYPQFMANGQQFTTRDRDNDHLWVENCAAKYKLAWWHNWCTKCSINGVWPGDNPNLESINWFGIGWTVALIPRTSMRITRDETV